MEGWGLTEALSQLPLRQPPLSLCRRSFSCVMGYNWQGYGVFGTNLAFLLFFLASFAFFPSLPPFPLLSKTSSSTFSSSASFLVRLRICSAALDLLRFGGGEAPRWRPLRVVGALDRVAGIV